jgi:RimJ/RimL family protein N-acetyltransferase
MASVVRPTYPVMTDRLLLRPFTLDDLDPVLEWERREDVHRYLYTEPRSRDEVAEALARRIEMSAIDADSQAIRLAVVLRDGGALIGDVSIQRTSEEHHQGEIGFLFHPDHHGRGYATEAAEVMLHLGFEGARLHRIIGRCDGRNSASARVMERLGMRREATFIENELIKGEWTDELVYAMLAGEWFARAGSTRQEASR